jgi:hypothetical protein
MIKFRKNYFFIPFDVCLLLLMLIPVIDASAQSVSSRVVPIKWTSFNKKKLNDEHALRSLKILLNTNKYALTSWWKEKGFATQESSYLTFGGIKEPAIRPPASEALALAISLKTGAYDERATTVSTDAAKAMAIKLAVSLAYQHKVNIAQGWGDEWQSAFWAFLAGTAGYLLWDDLSLADQEYVRRMVEYEANRFNDYAVPYYRDKEGTIIFVGDTKAEENAWNSSLLQLATAMMPKHPNWHKWMNKNIELMISSYARPSDLKNQTIFHGKKVADWLNGSNANEDGTVVNHNRIHPDYLISITQLFNAPLLYTLAGMQTPKAAFFNADVAYSALVDLNFKSPPYKSPGGTIYIENSPNVFYPQGNDWGTHRRLHFAYIDAAAHAFKFDHLVQKKGSYWEPLHAQMTLDMQMRPNHEDGHVYEAKKEDTYAGREEWVAQFAGRIYLTKWIMLQHKYSQTNKAY